jgi:KUP system potassium uptake protein
MPKASSGHNDSIFTEEGKRLPRFVLIALGIVFGDIGTSPLYAMRECFLGKHGPEVTSANVLGILSLIIWALILVIALKYQTFVLRADNQGEGGVLALMALVIKGEKPGSRRRLVLVSLGLFGAALLYGDSLITPAISVLSAIEGLRVATPNFDRFVVPIAVVILIGLFSFQSRGTSRVGKAFGPIVLLWFAVLALLGILSIVQEPGVLWAFDPRNAITFFAANGWRGFAVLGTVFLVVTGGEALYADMGHLGKHPIRIGWFALVLPALVLNYLGQGSLLIRDPESVSHLFYELAPSWAVYPLVALAAAATVIASQAVISGAFSLTQQAVQLGYFPRITIIHTSDEEFGQVYVPVINWVLFVGTVWLVLSFRESGRLAHAYGVAVTTTMLITTILMYSVARRLWHWRLAWAVPVTVAFLAVDVSFFGANIVKVFSGGWIPLLAAGLIYALFTSWKRGREFLVRRLRRQTMSLESFIADVEQTGPTRVPGLAVFMTGYQHGVPPALMHNYKHNKVLHEQVVLLTVETQEVPRVPRGDRLKVEELGQGLFRVMVHYGFSQDPDVPAALRGIDSAIIDYKAMSTSFFLGKETVLATAKSGTKMWRWQRHLFAIMSRNAQDAVKFFGIPPNRVVELGAQVTI